MPRTWPGPDLGQSKFVPRGGESTIELNSKYEGLNLAKTLVTSNRRRWTTNLKAANVLGLKSLKRVLNYKNGNWQYTRSVSLRSVTVSIFKLHLYRLNEILAVARDRQGPEDTPEVFEEERLAALHFIYTGM